MEPQQTRSILIVSEPEIKPEILQPKILQGILPETEGDTGVVPRGSAQTQHFQLLLSATSTSHSYHLQYAEGKLLCVDAQDQIFLLAHRNRHQINKSWKRKRNSSDGPTIAPGEHLMILNLDGVPLFKARKLTVWPFWLQCINLAAKLRLSFQNISLLAIWHGLKKTEWFYVLMKEHLGFSL